MTTQAVEKKTAPAKAATKSAPAKKAPAAKAAPAKKAAPAAKRTGKLRITTTNGSAVEHPELRDRKHARQIIRKLSEGKTLVLVDGDEKTTYKDGGQA